MAGNTTRGTNFPSEGFPRGKPDIPGDFNLTHYGSNSRGYTQLHPTNQDRVGSVREDAVSWQSHLRVLLEQFVPDIVVEAELLTLSVTLLLKGELDQVIVRRSTR